jgi:hypothetical protein
MSIGLRILGVWRYMVEFEKLNSVSGFRVVVDGRSFGFLRKDSEFYTYDNVFTNDPLDVSATDLRCIALKSEEVKKYGQDIPVCGCGGTPNFPEKVYSKNEGSIECQSLMHREFRLERMTSSF